MLAANDVLAAPLLDIPPVCLRCSRLRAPFSLRFRDLATAFNWGHPLVLRYTHLALINSAYCLAGETTNALSRHR
ncbi:MAG: hypothetical protein ABJA82_13025 [Myxococcales bacterium]